MKTYGQEIKTLRKKAKSWLAILTYYCAQGQISLDVTSQRLRSLYKPIFRPELLQGVISSTLSQVTSQKETPALKKRLMSRRASKRIESRTTEYLEILDRKTLGKAKQANCTLGRLLASWAVLTDQAPKDFIVRVYPSIGRLHEKWQKRTSCRGFSDDDCLSHPQEFAEFMSGFYRILIQETPEEKLKHVITEGISALGSIIETRGLDKTLYGLCGQANDLMTADAVEKIDSALKANPSAGGSLTTPEFQALVLREETKLGWSENTDDKAIEILQESFSSELEEAAIAKDEIIRNSLESISRRSLWSNLQDALNKQLRPRFIESIIHFLKYIVRVESSWEFDTSNLIEKNARSVQKWLFRR